MLPGKLLIIVIFSCFYRFDCSDPCTEYDFLARAEYRGGNCSYVFGKDVCDRTLSSTTWYRAVGLTRNLTIQTKPAELLTCGTKFPLWMNGSHPTVEDGEVERQACQTYLDSYCFRSVTINVKNCSSFYVYKMPNVQACSEGYCFGEDEECPPFDPCDVYENTAVSYDVGRSTSCNLTTDSSCDTFDTSMWYKFVGSSGYLTIASSCPSTTTCGAQSQLWINGTTAHHNNGTKTSSVCVRDGDDCCAQVYTIESKECSAFTVYRLIQVSSGQCQRYCTDDVSAVCPTTTTVTTTISTGPTHAVQHVRREGGSSGRMVWVIGLVIVALATGGIVGIFVTYHVLLKRRKARVHESQMFDKLTGIGQVAKVSKIQVYMVEPNPEKGSM